MVLKVVRAKILETLELSRVSTAFVFTRIGRIAKACQLSKIVSSQSTDYLVDNRCPYMLSEVEGQIKGKAVGTVDPVPIWECPCGRSTTRSTTADGPLADSTSICDQYSTGPHIAMLVRPTKPKWDMSSLSSISSAGLAACASALSTLDAGAFSLPIGTSMHRIPTRQISERYRSGIFVK
jgi:hypothetical protein